MFYLTCFCFFFLVSFLVANKCKGKWKNLHDKYQWEMAKEQEQNKSGAMITA